MPQPTERRTLDTTASVRLEQRDEGQPRITGYGAVFYRDGEPGTEYELWPAGSNHLRAVERVGPTAFDADLLSGADVLALVNHDDNQLLGRRSAGTLELYKDERGLGYRIAPDDEDPLYQQTARNIRKRNIQGSSFGFVVREDRWHVEGDKEVRTLGDVALYDVSPVVRPAYTGTTATARSQTAVEARSSHQAWQQSLQESRDAALEPEKQETSVEEIEARAAERAARIEEVKATL